MHLTLLLQNCDEYVLDKLAFPWYLLQVFDDIIVNSRQFGSLFSNITGYKLYYNYLHDKPYFPVNYGTFILQESVKQAINVGNTTFSYGEQVLRHQLQDFMQSVKPWIQELLEHYKILMFNGQLDIVIAYPLTVNFLDSLQWSSKEEHLKAKRVQWHVKDELAGYVKTAGNLVEVMVRNAGHLVALDQPSWVLDLMNRFTADKPFHD